MAKVLFIQKRQRILQEYIGIMQLSAYLKMHHHSTDLLLAEDDPDEVINYILDFKPDIIGFSVMIVESKWVLEMASYIKKKGIAGIIIAGGAHPTYEPDFINNDCIDVINIGEGEASLLDLANAVDKGEPITGIQNLHVKKDGQIFKNPIRPLLDYNALPLPDRDIYLKYPFFKEQRIYSFTVSSGCPYECNFCFINRWKRLYDFEDKHQLLRLKSVDKAIAEILDFSQKTKVSLITFADSTFNLDKKWTLDFMAEYKKRVDILFNINLRANLIDEDIVKAVADTNLCQSVRIGIEVGNEKLRKEVLGKKISNDQIYHTKELLEKYKINFAVYIMLGVPGETLENAFETIEMCQRIKPSGFYSFIFQPYPGLPLTDYAIQNGYLKHEDLVKLTEKNNYVAFNSVLQQKEISEIINLHKFSSMAINSPHLFPLIKRLVKCRPNPVFDFVYMLSSFIMYNVQFKQLKKLMK